MDATWIKHGIDDDGDTLLIREKLVEVRSHLCLANTQSLHSGAHIRRSVPPRGFICGVAFLACCVGSMRESWVPGIHKSVSRCSPGMKNGRSGALDESLVSY